MKPKTIGIDGRMLAGGSGIARYIEQLVIHLAKQPGDFRYVLFVLPETKQKIENGTYLSELKDWQIVEADVRWYSLAEQINLPNIIRKANIDLMHFPHWNIPVLYRGPFVVTIHDLIMYHFARAEATTLGPVKYWIKDMVHRFVISRAVKTAKNIIVPTQFTKQDLVQTLKIDNQHIIVNHEAPFPIATDTLKKEYTSCIDAPYVLYVGNAYPHKNVKRLVEAWKMVEAREDRLSLVLIGRSSTWYDELQQQVDDFVLERVYIYHDVDDAQLSQMYACAESFVFPSEYEGFGLPPLEAMQHGVPVISSSASCLPEVLGEAAFFVDETSSAAIAQGILQVHQDPDLRFDLKQKGRTRFQQFSWEHHANTTKKAYK